MGSRRWGNYMRISPVVFVIMLLAVAEPALAATAAPEPANFALFLLGVAGLIIGRRSAVARRRPKDDSVA